MTLDLERTSKLISSLQGALRLLRELAAIPEGEFASDNHKQGSAKYNLIVAIECVIDLGAHVISRRRLRVAEDYADTFIVLAEAGLLPQDFAEELRKMARFRNRLVHMYWAVDTVELHKVLRERLGDFDRFLTCMGAVVHAEA